MVKESKELATNDGGKAITENKMKELTNIEVENGQIKLTINKDFEYGKCPIFINKPIKEGETMKQEISLKESEDSFSDIVQKLTATKDLELGLEILKKGTIAIKGGEVTERINLALQDLADREPKDSTEAKLCLQSTALYSHGMEYLSQAGSNKNLVQSEFYLKNAIKLLRLNNETIEALNKYKRGGTQNVVVQHVQVNDGGKAIVGNMIAGGGVN